MRLWTALPHDPALPAARALYERSFDARERIPWEWIARALGDESRRAAGWWTHLILTAAGDAPTQVVGLFEGVSVRGFGGYASYLAVDPTHRRAGVATELYAALFAAMRAAADVWGEPLPFVLWDSRPPASADEWPIWRARLKLFHRIGASYCAGANFLTPDYAERAGPPLALQLFVRRFDAAPPDGPELRRWIAELHRRVYKLDADDPIAQATQASSAEVALRPMTDHPDFPREAAP